MAITEVAFLPLKQNHSVKDEASADGKTHSDCRDILLSQDGCQKAYWGIQEENTSLLLWFVDWDTTADHINFTKANAFQSLGVLFGSILGGAPSAYHVNYEPHTTGVSANVFNAPTVEIVTIWFPSSYSKQDQEKVTQDAVTFLSVFQKEAKEYRGSSIGWVEEEIDNPEAGEKGKAFSMLVGWTSAKAHKDFTQSQSFNDSIQLIIGAKDMKKIEAVHASFTEASKK